MKRILYVTILALVVSIPSVLKAQSTAPLDTKKHKIVIHYADPDSVSQVRVTQQLQNIRTIWPNAEIEVVCFSGGLDMIMSKNSKVSKAVADWSSKGVIFAACNNTMKVRDVKKEDLLSQAVVVPSAIIEMATKQEEGWSYFKAGKF